MKTLVVIQARMGSSRLPGKVLLPLAGQPALTHVLERVAVAKTVDRIIVATSTLPADDPLAEFCQSSGIDVVRGSENDVLARYLLALGHFPADIVVRVTGDCPLTDPALIDELVQTMKSDPRIDYHSNTQAPRKIPHGLDVEVIRAEALRRAGHEAQAQEEREHVTPYLYRHPELFQISRSDLPVDLSAHRWTLDTPRDHELLERVLLALPPGAYRWQDTLAVFANYPEWVTINASIVQKSLTSGS